VTEFHIVRASDDSEVAQPLNHDALPFAFGPSVFVDDSISPGLLDHSRLETWHQKVKETILKTPGGVFGEVHTPFFPGEEMGDVTKWNAVEQAYAVFMKELGIATGFEYDEECVRNTPNRIARLMKEMVIGKEECEAILNDAFSKTFTSNTPEMIIFEDVRCVGLCPHHMLPVFFRGAIGYIPNEKVIGASKFERIARAIARRPVLQEQLCWDLAKSIFERLDAKGVGVVLAGSHTCMSARGVKSSSRMITSAMKGVFHEEPHAKAEFLRLAGYGGTR